MEPELPDDIHAEALDRSARDRLRTLGRDNADRVARHLVAAGRLIDSDPERAYAHAQAAHRRGGRVDVVREALGLTAYVTGRYAEALRELRAARRLSGVDVHRAIEADCERGLGRPERALALALAPESAALSPVEAVELAIVASGARLDMGDPEAALAVLESREVSSGGDAATVRRVAAAKGDVLIALGRTDEAAALLEAASLPPDEEVIVLDLLDDDGAEGGVGGTPSGSGAEGEGDAG